jgi:hypothetical protein
MNKRIRKKRLRQVLLAELATRFGEPEAAIRWLETANAELGGRTPHEAIAGGEVAAVTLLLDGMGASAGGGR